LKCRVAGSIELELRNLQFGYASALAQHDALALRAVFHRDATLRVFEPDAEDPVGESRASISWCS
jgi:hypothetical protein